jgi:hypothetical protein
MTWRYHWLSTWPAHWSRRAKHDHSSSRSGAEVECWPTDTIYPSVCKPQPPGSFSPSPRVATHGKLVASFMSPLTTGKGIAEDLFFSHPVHTKVVLLWLILSEMHGLFDKCLKAASHLKPPHTWAKVGGRRGTNGENGQNASELNESK